MKPFQQSRRNVITAAGALTCALIAKADLAGAQSKCVAKSPDQGGSDDRNAIKTIFFDLGSTLVNTSERSWLPGMQEGLNELRSRGMPLGIISNTYDYTRQEVAEKFLPPDFKFSDFSSSLVILSCEVDTEKPNRRIWLLAAERASEPIHNCLFIGEDLGETWHAQQAGMQALRLGDPKTKNTSCLGDTGADMKTLIELLDGKA